MSRGWRSDVLLLCCRLAHISGAMLGSVNMKCWELVEQLLAGAPLSR